MLTDGILSVWDRTGSVWGEAHGKMFTYSYRSPYNRSIMGDCGSLLSTLVNRLLTNVDRWRLLTLIDINRWSLAMWRGEALNRYVMVYSQGAHTQGAMY